MQLVSCVVPMEALDGVWRGDAVGGVWRGDDVWETIANDGADCGCGDEPDRGCRAVDGGEGIRGSC